MEILKNFARPFILEYLPTAQTVGTLAIETLGVWTEWVLGDWEVSGYSDSVTKHSKQSKHGQSHYKERFDSIGTYHSKSRSYSPFNNFYYGFP